MKTWRYTVLIFAILIIFVGNAVAEENDFWIHGSAKWELIGGWGDVSALSGYDGTTEGFRVLQKTKADMGGTIANIISLTASIDNYSGNAWQLVGGGVRIGNAYLSIGDFTYRPKNPDIMSTRRLKGFRFNYEEGKWGVQGLAARVLGIPVKKVFKGNTSSDSILYTESTYSGWNRMIGPLRGTPYFEVDIDLDPDFTSVELEYTALDELSEFLEVYNMDYLIDILGRSRRVVNTSNYIFLGLPRRYMVLKTHPLSILRSDIKTMIREYNWEHGLYEGKVYPFIEGSEEEAGFLETLSREYVFISASHDSNGQYQARLSEYKDSRFYYLGHEDILSDIQVEYVQNGRYVKYAHGVQYLIWSSEGILEFTFPEGFYDEYQGIKVSYRHTVAEGLFFLGTPVVLGSEVVALNGKLLKEDIDYVINYEAGLIILRHEVAPNDILEVEYEHLRGGLAGAPGYNRYIYGGSTSFNSGNGLKLHVEGFYASDKDPGMLEPEYISEMPNSHMVIGLTGEYNLGDSFNLDLSLAYSKDVFPFDSRKKDSLKNQVNVIVVDDGVVVAGDANGIALYQGGSWSTYGTREGLSGTPVLSLLSTLDYWVIGTGSGMSLMTKDEGTKWTRINTTSAGIGQRVQALAVQDMYLWVGTDQGLGRLDLLTCTSWEKYPALKRDNIQALLVYDGILYVGTDNGLSVYEDGEFTGVLDNVSVVSIIAHPGTGTIYVGTKDGLWTYPDRELIVSQEILSLGISGGEVWYGTSNGLYGAVSGLVPGTEGCIISALGGTATSLWACKDGYTLFEVGGIEYPRTVTGLQETDDYRYQDLDPDEHTFTGGKERFNLNYRWDSGRAYLLNEIVDYGYLPIGGTKREDKRIWEAGITQILWDLGQLGYSHSKDVLNQTVETKKPSAITTDAITLKITRGINLDVSYEIDRIDEFNIGDVLDRRDGRFSILTREGFLNQALTAELQYLDERSENILEPGMSYSLRAISGKVDLRANRDLRFSFAYNLPLEVYGVYDGKSGRKIGDFTANWVYRPSFGINTLRFYTSFRGEPDDRVISIENRLNAKAFELKGHQVNPYFRLQWDSLDRKTPKTEKTSVLIDTGARLDGKLTSIRIAVSGKGIEEPLVKKRITDINTRVSLEYRMNPYLTPNMSLIRQAKVTTHGTIGSQRLDTTDITGAIRWLGDGLQANTSLSRFWQREGTYELTRYTVTGKVQKTISPNTTGEFGVAYVNRKGSTKDGQVLDDKVSLDLSAEHRLNGGWSVGAAFTYVIGKDITRKEPEFRGGKVGVFGKVEF